MKNKAKIQQWLIKKLGGFTNKEVDSMTDEFSLALKKEQDKWTKKEVLTAAVKDLYNIIGKDDILRETSTGVWMTGDREINEGTKNLLISQAQQMLNTKLWKYLQYDIKYKANKRMFLEAQDVYDVTWGKLALYLLDIINTRLDSLSKESGRFKK